MANRPPRKVSIAEANHNMWRKMEAGGTGRPELFAPLCPLLLILDANAAMADVQAMARRRDPEALTDLRRAIRDQSVLVFAPEVLRDEMRKHLPRLGELRGLSREGVVREWRRLAQMIHFLTPLEVTRVRKVVDPKDIPYLALCLELTADGVCSEDRDIAEMGATMVHPNIVKDWEAYGRRAAVAYPARQATAAGTIVATVVGVAAVSLAIRVWKGMPTWMKMLTLIAGVYVTIQVATSSDNEASGAADEKRPPEQDLFERFGEWYATANAGLSEARAKVVPPAKRRSARGAAIAALAMKGSAMSTSDLLRGMEAIGYRSRGQQSETYLRRLLGSKPDFESVKDGLWQLTVARQGPDTIM